MEMQIALAVLGVATVVGLGLAARSATTICVLRVRDGRATISAGKLAPRIFSDIGDVVRTPPVRSAVIRIVKRDGRAEVRASGELSPAQAQRVRNVVGSVPLARLRNAG
jgi:hypothetical protein